MNYTLDDNPSRLSMYSYVILDFDGVVVNIDLDWKEVKRNLAEVVNTTQQLSLTNLYLLSQARSKKETFIKVLSSYEIKALKTKQPSKLLSLLQKINKPYSIISNNTHASIDYYFSQIDSTYQPEYIVAIDDVSMPKPHPEGIEKLLSINNNSSTVLIGDRQTDEIAAWFAKIDYINFSLE